ncbi:hypothetical protein SAMN05421687_101359 [Salimicrobium flavidum]|uniref:Uncharacterized protein n=1 Tax=Salimicrobium flavidum TaxID=570947 RepID=A0A1N7IKG8_9BACI|nr:hypothetical protein SAMN05421687_101359 [Salimicrobium flavidum]
MGIDYDFSKVTPYYLNVLLIKLANTIKGSVATLSLIEFHPDQPMHTYAILLAEITFSFVIDFLNQPHEYLFSKIFSPSFSMIKPRWTPTGTAMEEDRQQLHDAESQKLCSQRSPLGTNTANKKRNWRTSSSFLLYSLFTLSFILFFFFFVQQNRFS